MYRYTAIKNKKHNHKFKQKNLKIKQISMKKKRAKPIVDDIKKSKKVLINQQKVNWSPFWLWIKKLLKMSLNISLALFLCYLIGVIAINIFLPQIIGLNEEKSLLLVQSNTNERAAVIYLVKLMPQNKSIVVTEMSGDLQVPVSGGYGYYPLGSLAPLLKFETNNLEQIKGAYNFALKKIVDEVYFLPSMNEVKKSEDLQELFFGLAKSDLVEEGALNMNYVKLFFEVKTSNNFKIVKLEAMNDEISGRVLAESNKEKLVNCPVVLVNAAGVNGLVRKVSEMVEINGFLVVNWETAAKAEEKSVIYYDESESECKEVAETMKRIFPMIETVVEDGGEQAKKNRAKALIILGSEVAN